MSSPRRFSPQAVLFAALLAGGAFSCRVDRIGTGEIVTATDAAADVAEAQPDIDAPDTDADGSAGSDGAADASAEDVFFDADACEPVTCQQLGATCGSPQDGCGQALSCGLCPSGQGCGEGHCVGVRYVVPLGAGTQDGTSWDNALPSVQAGVDKAEAGDEIWVARGTYTSQTPGVPVATLKPGVRLFGGFAGTEQERSARDVEGNPTTLDGTNTNRVVQGATDILVDGFVLRAGNVGDNGAGMWLVSAQGAQIANCIFQQNSAGVWGAGIYALDSSVSVTRSRFEGNNARQGGGLFNDHSTITVDSCVFDGNTVDNSSGGGGAVFNFGGPATITNSVFYRNRATPYFGGAVYNSGDQAFRFVNCTFYGNQADQSGGAMFDNVGAKPVLINSILWGDSPDEIYDWSGSGPPSISYSDVQGVDGGVGNINADPGFEDAPSGKLGLTSGSPCIDSANGTDAPAADALGHPRVDDPATPNTGAGTPDYADMGAYEYQP